jgi:hypothetical protein
MIEFLPFRFKGLLVYVITITAGLPLTLYGQYLLKAAAAA